MILNSVGTKIFRNLYSFKENNSETQDILENGNLSCAVFVSSILFLNGLVNSQHAVVDSVIEDLKKKGWKKIQEEEIEKGSIIVWGKGIFSTGSEHKHIGFYIGNKKAISNNTNKGFPIIHNWKKNNKGIESIWIKKDLLN